jgi:hypothetical protein
MRIKVGKVRVGGEYQTHGGEYAIITDWHDTKESVIFVGCIRYRDPGMANLIGVQWDFMGKCLNHSSKYDLCMEVNFFTAPPSSTPPSNEKPTNPKDMIDQQGAVPPLAGNRQRLWCARHG